MDTVPFPVQGLCYWWLKLLEFGSCLVVHGWWCACSDSWYDNSSFTVVTGVGRKARFETREADYMSSIEKHPSCAFGSESNCHLNSIFFYIISYTSIDWDSVQILQHYILMNNWIIWFCS
jgi:hypothetical protein